MEKVLDLKMLGVQELGREELREVDGGSIPGVLKALGRRLAPVAVVMWVVENWDDVKAGAVDGWNENH